MKLLNYQEQEIEIEFQQIIKARITKKKKIHENFK